jgi:hypothetical protein
MTGQDWANLWPSVQLAGHLSTLAKHDHTQIVRLIMLVRAAFGAEGEREILKALTGMRDAAQGQLDLANAAIQIVEICRKLADEAAMAAIVPSEKVTVLDPKRRKRGNA